MKVLSAILEFIADLPRLIFNFFKSRKVQIWVACMVVVIVAAFGILSWVMVANKIEFGVLTYAKTSLVDGKPVTTDEEFHFIPSLEKVDTITFSNNNEDFTSNTKTLNNNMIGGELDSIELLNQANMLVDILDLLDNGRRTNAFRQFFTGGASGRERVSSTSTRNFEELSNGVWIKIVFASPQFVVNHDGNYRNMRIEKFEENYQRPTDGKGLSVGLYNLNIINAIRIPLGNTRNSFTQQTWFISTGGKSITNTTSIDFSFTTFGNYRNLSRFVSNIDDATLI